MEFGIISEGTGYAIYNNASGIIEITSGSVSAKSTSGIYNNAEGTIKVIGGTVTGYTNGIVNAGKGTVTLGSTSDDLSTSSPAIIGQNSYGISSKNENSTFNFYNGVVKGKAKSSKNDTTIELGGTFHLRPSCGTITKVLGDLYATTLSKIVTVSFEPNGGTNSTSSKDVTFSSEYGLKYDSTKDPLPEPEKDGYIFEGWYLNDSNLIKDDTIVETEENHTLKANWKAITYIIEYDKNADGAMGTTEYSTHTYDVAKNLTANGYEYEGYRFKGWNTNANGTGTAYTDKQSVKNLSKDQYDVVTLYAQWEPITYTVIYDGNGATGGSTANSEHVYGVEKELTKNGYTKTGYKFTGWNTNASGEGQHFEDEEKVKNLTVDETITLYAQWEPITYTIVYDGNGATSGTTASSSHTYDVTKNLTTNGYEKKGYVFKGWNTKKDGSGTSYENKASVKNLTTTDGATITLYAKWGAIEYTVVYNGNGSTGGSTTTSTHTYDIAKKLTKNGYTKTGYTFKAWNTKADGTGTSYSDEASVKNLASTDGAVVNLYAQWRAHTYTVVYDGNGATDGSTANSSHTYDVAKNLTANGYTKTGYLFKSWNTQANGKGTSYLDKANVKNLTAVDGATVTLYAQWTPITYTVTYNGNGSTGGSTANSTHTYDVAKNLTANGYTRTGYTFKNWTLTPDGTGDIYANKQSVTNLAEDDGATVTLYAQWTINTSKLTINPDGGSVKVTSPTGGTAETITETKTYTQNYNTTLTYGEPTKANGTDTYTVTFNYNGSGASNTTETATKTTTYSFEKWEGSEPFYGKLSNLTGSGTYTYSAENNVTSTIKAKYTSSSSTTSVTLPSPTRTGYTFGGWYTESSCKNKIPDEEKNYTPAGNITLYAKWIIHTSKLTINPDNGSVKITSPTGGTAETITETKTYTQNYNTTLTYGTPTKSNGTETYTVTYDAQGGSVSPESATATATTTFTFTKWIQSSTFYGKLSNLTGSGKYTYPADDNVTSTITASYSSSTSTTSVTLPTPTKKGYTFGGWYSDEEFKTSVGGSEDSYTPPGNVTLCAKWDQEAGPTYTSYEVKNLSNSGYDVYVYGVSDPTGVDRAQFPTWTSYNDQDDLPASWNTSSAAAGADEGNGTWHFRVNTTDHNGECGQYYTHIYLYDSLQNYTKIIVDSSKTIVPGITVTIKSSNTSYGTVSPTTVSVGYGAKYSSSGTKMTFPGGQTVTASAISEAGYTTSLSSWSPASGTITGATTVTANFVRTANRYTVTLNKGTGISSVTGEGTYSYGEKVTINATTSTGYSWSKWSGTYTSTTQNYSFAMPAQNVTLTANAKIDSYTITYATYNLVYGFGDVSSTKSGRMTYSIKDNVITVKADETDGYGFVPYRVDLEANKTYIFSLTTSGTYKTEAEAFWMLDGAYNTYYYMDSASGYKFTPTVSGTYYLRLDVNTAGNTCTFSNIRVAEIVKTATINHGSTYGDTMPTPTKTGYSFVGWFDDNYVNNPLNYYADAHSDLKNAFGYNEDNLYNHYVNYGKSEGRQISQYISTDTVTEAKTLYGYMKPGKYTITYNANGGTGAPSAQTKTHGVNITLSTTEPTLSGHNFLGWSTSSSASNPTYAPGATYTENGNVTLYAVWSTNSYSVTLNKGTGIASVTGAGTYEYGATVTLDATLSTGYHWSKWSGTYEITTQKYTLTMPAQNVTLTANAAINTSTLKINPNGGSVVVTSPTGGTATTITSTKSYTQNYNTTLTIGTPTKNNDSKTLTITYNYNYTDSTNTTANTTKTTAYSFKGWEKSSPFHGDLTNGVYTFSSSNGVTDTIKANYDEEYTYTSVTTPKPTREGYTFGGWYREKECETEVVEGGESYSPKGNITLYAKWNGETGPTYDSYEVKNLSSSGYDVYVYGVSDDTGMDRVQFPTWTTYNDQDDIQSSWQTSSSAAGTDLGNGTWHFRVNTTDHNGECGQYKTHVYLYDTSGKYFSAFEVDITKTVVPGITVTIKSNNTSYGTVSPTTVSVGYGAKYSSSGTKMTFPGGQTVTASAISASGYVTSLSSWSPASGTITSATTVTANFTRTAGNYTVTLTKGTGIATVTGAGTYSYGSSVTVNATLSPGYHWSKWSGTYNTTEQQYTFTMPASNVTLTANAAINTSTLIVNPNGGSASVGGTTITSTKSYTQNYNTTLTVGAPTKETETNTTTYTVTYNAEGGSVSPESATATRTTIKKFSGSWTKSSSFHGDLTNGVYTFSVDNGVTDTLTASYASTVSSDTTTSVTLPTPTREGYTFTGWYTAASGGTKVGAGGDSYTPKADETLHAVWSKSEYTVTLNKGTGIASVTGAGTYSYGSAVTITATASTGYTWSKWTSSRGTGLTHASHTFTMPASNVTLTANATINTSTLTINPNGGSVSVTSPTGGTATTITSTKSYTQNYNTTLTYGTPTPPSTSTSTTTYTVTYNYTGSGLNNTTATATKTTTTTFAFDKWEITSNYLNNFTSTTGGGTYTFPADNGVTSTLTANYTPSSSSTTTSVTLPTPIMTGYTFTGWYTAASGGTKVGVGGTSYAPPESITLYAQWTANTYTVTFKHYKGNSDNSSYTLNETSTASIAYGTSITISSYKKTYTGFTYSYASNTCSTSGGPSTITTKTITGSCSIGLYYKRNSYTITYNVNGGYWNDGTTDDITKTKYYGTTLTIISEKPKKDGGYVFAGWSISDTATSATYSSGGSFTTNGSTTLYAVYEVATVSSIKINNSSTWIWYNGGTYTVSATITMADQNATVPNINWSLYTELGSLNKTTTSNNGSVTFTSSTKGIEYIYASAGGVSTYVTIYCYNHYFDGTYGNAAWSPRDTELTLYMWYGCCGSYVCSDYYCITYDFTPGQR